jgi:hypothetical protein
LVESIADIGDIAIRDSRATHKFRVVARMRVSCHAMSDLLVASFSFRPELSATND